MIDLIYNLTLLVALSVVSGFIDLRWSRDTRSGLLLQGALFGGAALIAMLRPLNLGPGLIFDGRSVMVSLGGLFFGPWVAALAGLMTITLRIVLGGSGTLMGVLVILSSALIGVVFQRRWQGRIHTLRAGQLWRFGLLVHLVMLALAFTLPDNAGLAVLASIGWPIILTYPVATVLIGKILSDQASQIRFVADLKHSEERFRTVADFTYDWEYWAAPDGRILYMSPSCERITGYRAEEFQQDQGLLISIVQPDDRPGVVAHLQAMMGYDGMGKEIYFRLITRGGEERWIGHSCQPVHGHTGLYLGRRVSNRDITERVQAEAALRASEEKYRALVENISDVIYTLDTDGRFTYISPVIEHMSGHRAGDILGQSFTEFIHPDDLPGLNASLNRTMRGEREPFEFRVLKGAEIRQVRTSSQLIFNNGVVVGLTGILTDITERKQAEQKLELLAQAGRELSATLNLSDIYATLHRIVRRAMPCDYFFVSDFDADDQLIRCKYVSGPQAEFDVLMFPPIPLEATGHGTQSLVIRNGEPLLLNDYAAYLQTANTTYYVTEAGQLAPDLTEEEEKESPHSVLLVPLKLEGQVVGVLQAQSMRPNDYTPRDRQFLESLGLHVSIALANARLFAQIQNELAERQRLEQALIVERDLLERRVIDRTRDLAAANDRLQDLDRLKSKFVSDVSHELRSPITNLMLYLNLLERGQPEKRTRYLTTAIEQANRMKQLIEDILDLSRLEREAAAPVLEPIDLNAVLERVVIAQQPRAEAAGLLLTFDAGPGQPLARGDVNQLLQVFTNLISNAISYTPAGEIRITSRAAPSPAENFVCVEVRDTGLGIDPADVPHLFERFYRGQRTRGIRGTGLGLAIVQEIVVAHGGRLEVDSQVGAGSTFRVYLPGVPHLPAASPEIESE